MDWFTLANANQSTLDAVVDSLKWQPMQIVWGELQSEMPTNLDWINQLTVRNANQSTLDGEIYNFNYPLIYIA